jgi:hypothetical protein
MLKPAEVPAEIIPDLLIQRITECTDMLDDDGQVIFSALIQRSFFFIHFFLVEKHSWWNFY